MPDRTLLVADDDPGLRESLERTLTREGYRVLLASDGRAALERLQDGAIDLIVTDLKMPGLTGLELLRAAKAIAPDVDVILLTAFGTVEEAVKAMKDGAYDFLTKPFRREQLLKLIDKALERRELIERNKVLQQRLDDLLRQGAIVGGSPAFRRMMMLVEQVASSSATVLIQGESGTGKELVARAIHERSTRAGKPFVAVNCAALPETLLESELFGYERGAFTGAAGRKEGRFELADGGTLFLDEVADLSAVTQPKILRVLQEGEFDRLGATRSIKVDVRLVAASNQDLVQMVKERRFREDLFYRLNVITVHVPPLRERREDIPMLAQHFLRVYAAKNNRRLDGLTDDALKRLEAWAWPGNVRELENVIERGVVLARGTQVDIADLPPEIAGATPLPEGVVSVRIGTPLAEVEQRLLDATLAATGGNKTLAAKLLGIDVRTVARKLERWEEERSAEETPPAAPPLETLSIDLAMARDPVDADVAHAHTWYADMAGLWIRTLHRIPLVVTLHSMEPLRPWKADQLGSGYLLSSWIEKTAVEAADRVIAVSNKMRDDILAHFDADPARVVVIHNGIDPDRFRRTDQREHLDRLGVNSPYVLFVGRVTDQKGIFHLLEAAKLLPAGVQLLLCAAAPDTPEIEARLRRAVAALPNVLWINEMVKHDIVVQLYSHAA